MNLDISALLSLYSGLTGADASPGKGMTEGGLPEGFAAALSEQLALLGRASQDNAPRQVVAEWRDLQNLAASSGKELPLSEQTIDIDLEATLEALARVLATLESDDAGVNPALSADDETEADGLLGALAASLPAELVREAETMKASDGARLSESAISFPAAEKATQDEPGRVMQPVLSADSAKAGAAAEQREQGVLATREMPVGSEEKPSVAGINEGRANDGSAQQMLDDLARMNRVAGNEAKTELAPLGRHFANPQWGRELSDRLVWMHRQNIPSAELNLNPRHLGPISIRIDVNQDQTSIAFSAQHAVVKEAIEAALPRLREMLGAQQLNLVNVDVSQQQSDRDSGGRFSHLGGQAYFGDDSFRREQAVSGLVEEVESGRAVAVQGILNLFA